LCAACHHLLNCSALINIQQIQPETHTKMKPNTPDSSFRDSIQASLQVFELLQKYNKKLQATPLLDLMNEQARFEQFSIGMDGMLLDFSRTHINREAFDLLLKLAKVSELELHRDRLFSGAHVNLTEDRPAMHMALRSRELGVHLPDGEMKLMEEGMQGMLDIAGFFHRRAHPFDETIKVRNIVHVGIGGSLLGPRLLCDVLGSGQNGADTGKLPSVHFLGSVDAHHREDLLRDLDPSETVVILASKSFTTGDTLMHGVRLQQWMEMSLGTAGTSKRFFAVTGEANRAIQFGVPQEQVLFLPAWVGGRYSLWSPVSLTAASIGGPEAFQEMLLGAAALDRHFQQAELHENLPVIMGLLGVWHRNVCNYSNWGVIPYDQRLRGLPGHLQQLIMESNGKSVDINGEPAAMFTSPVVFGESGTDAQHSLFQAMHQGSDRVPLNLIAVIRPDHQDKEAHAELLANMLAQAMALAGGRSLEQTRIKMEAEIGAENLACSEHLIAHRCFEGNRPTELLLLDDLSPANLGKLLALYEHKVFVESAIWGINAFDQWGVELGKTLTPDIKRALETGSSVSPGLQGLMTYIRNRS
jgi:glucose-6-phosphate isomerase